MLRPAIGFAGLLTALILCNPLLADDMALQNGRTVVPYPDLHPNDTYRYYGSQETVLDPDFPTANFGAELETGLVAGSDRKVLIEFRELSRAIGPEQDIIAAWITFQTVPGAWSPDNEIHVYRLLKPFRQGSHSADDLAPQHWTSSYDHQFYSTTPGDTLAWDQPGAAGADTDRAAATSVVTTTGTSYNATTGEWRIVLPRSEINALYRNHHRNHGWVIEYADAQAADGENRFYTSEHPDIALRPALTVRYRDADPAPRDVDLNVTHIARTPQYYRYGPVYANKVFHDDNTGIMKFPDFAETKKWPDNGDEVTFTAHVTNKGLTTPSGPFTWRWKINGAVIASGTEPVGLAPGASSTYAVNWLWDANDFANDTDPHRKSLDHRDRTVTFEVDHDDQIAEQSEHNNQVTDFIEAPGMGFYVEQSMYDYFNDTLNQSGSYSFEDWIQWKVRVWNETWLEMSRYEGFAEDGSYERVRIQHIGVVPDGSLNPGGNHVPIATGTDYQLDGEWGFLPDANYVAKWSKLVEWGLLHECTHQLGMIDLYTMNMETGTPSQPSKVQVKDGTPDFITRGYYPPFGGLMGGGDTRYNENYEATRLMSGWTIGALNTNVGYRRGFYGEQLYDVPATVNIRAVDPDGNPIPFAEFKIWQSRGGITPDETLYDWQPIFQGFADENGVATLPNYDTLEPAPFTTITGHTLKPNPWGRINVVGVNGSLLVKASADGQRDYQFMRVAQVNLEYWNGHTDEVTFDLEFQIAPTQNFSTENIAAGKPAATNGGATPLITDDDVETRLSLGNAPAGTWIQVDLLDTFNVARVQIVHNQFGQDFFSKFRIETSTTGAFTGEQEYFNSEDVGWWQAAGLRRDIDPQDERISTVTYAGTPRPARYVRITAEEGNWTNFVELRVQRDLPNADTTPPAAVTDLTVTDVSRSAARLTWTAPGDDGFDGTVSGYDLRLAPFPLTPANFESADPVPNIPVPLPGGTAQEILIRDLVEGETFYVALQSRDDQFQFSDLSNVASFTTTAGGNCVEFTALSTPVDSSFASAMTSDGATLYFLRRDSHAIYQSTDNGASWQLLTNVASALGNYHGDWLGENLDFSPHFGDAGALFTTHRDDDNVQRVARYDLATDTWTLTNAHPAFSHAGLIVDDYYYGIAHAVAANFGGPVNRVDLQDPAQELAERTTLAGIIGAESGWFSRAATLTAVDGIVYGIKNDWITPNGDGDRIYRFDPTDFDASNFNGSGLDDLWNSGLWQAEFTEADDLGDLPFEVGHGAVIVGLPPAWNCDVGSQGGLFIIAGRQPSNHEGWGPASSDYAIFDIATQTLNTLGTLPAPTGSGTAAALHAGALYIKRGGQPQAPYNTTLWRVAPTAVLVPGDLNCDGTLDFFDIDPFVTALLNASDYANQFPGCDRLQADLDGDGMVNFFDIDPFVEALLGN